MKEVKRTELKVQQGDQIEWESGFRTREKSLLQREGGLRSASRHHYLSCHVKPVKSVGRAKETRQYGYTDSRKQEKTSKEDR